MPQLAPKPKAIWLSKTFWFNIITGTMQALLMADLSFLEPSWAGPLAIAQLVGNVWLRAITSEPVKVV